MIIYEYIDGIIEDSFKNIVYIIDISEFTGSWVSRSRI